MDIFLGSQSVFLSQLPPQSIEACYTVLKMKFAEHLIACY